MTAKPPRQLPLDFPEVANWTAEDFVLSPANEQAWDRLQSWPEGWNDPVYWLTGPEGSGKSHMLALWQAQTHARALTRESLHDRPALEWVREGLPLILDDVEPMLQRREDEEALFHLLNAVREGRGWLVLASPLTPSALLLTLPDLRSRLLALPLLTIEAPDDGMLTQLLVKQLHDRQLEADPRVLTYILCHTERSYAGIRRVVRRIDQLALALKQGVTVPLVKAALALDEDEATS